MKVVVDGIAFENPHQRGVQRYHRELIERFPPDIESIVLLGDAPRATLPARARRVDVLPSLIRVLPRKWRRSLGDPLSRPRRRVAESGADLFHSSYFTLPTGRMPTVITVYDMAVERYIEFFNTKWAAQEIRRKKAAILAADIIITISKATGNELTVFYPETAGRIVPIHMGADHIPESAAGPSAAAAPFALFVGDRGGYKNFGLILEAMAVPSWPKHVTLTVVGPSPLENEQMMADRMARGRVSFIGRVDEAELARLYREASATVVPSLVEGFGFPIVEAQRAGCPVACSDIPVFREVARDSVAYFDPGRPDELADAIADILDKTRAAALRDTSRSNARSFTWDRCITQTLDAYRRAIEAYRLNPRPPHSIPAPA
jgi:mannosyltransferase